MPILDRRVQVLFDREEYAMLAALAARQQRSVGSVVRDSVRKALTPSPSARQVALSRLLARADADDGRPVGDWEQVKDGFERDSLRAIQ